MKSAPVAILYQALPPPLINGLRKDAKPGGYSDGGADIAFALRTAGVDVVTPSSSPAPDVALDWVFPDTADGIRRAEAGGATVLWANTVLFEEHPLEQVLGDYDIVGQLPAAMQAFDDKFETNHLINFGILGCKHDDWNIRTQPDLLADQIAIELGHHQIQQNHISTLGLEFLNCNLTVLGLNNVIALFFEHEHQRFPE